MIRFMYEELLLGTQIILETWVCRENDKKKQFKDFPSYNRQ